MVVRRGVTLWRRLATRDCTTLSPWVVGLFEPDALRRRHLFLDFYCRRRRKIERRRRRLDFWANIFYAILRYGGEGEAIKRI